ncbi:hypothetical protein GCK32_002528 [Trichostrongylus colubriformis]|uniref:Uncharacterized protein n=1 Tax=Trichostrongylus colubriformis TaxID=6319 RepID=A0AAN8F1M5_TRICO
MDNRPCPFVRSTYYMNAERPWATCGEETLPTHHRQAASDDPKQINHPFPAHFPQQKPSIFKPSAYVNELPSYTVNYYMENSPNLAKILENEAGSIDIPVTTEPCRQAQHNVPQNTIVANIGENSVSPLLASQGATKPEAKNTGKQWETSAYAWDFHEEVPCSQAQQNVPQNTIVANIGENSVSPLLASQEATKPEAKNTGKQWETSAYAWNFHEEVPDMENTIKLDFEVGQDVFATASQALPLEYSNNIDEMESPVEYMKPKYSTQLNSPSKSEKYISPLESQYIGIPNDFYLAYSSCPQQFPDITVSNVIQSPYELQTVHAVPVQANQQPIGTIDAGIDPKDLPAPVHFPSVHYAAQYSPYGEAFSPVRPSAYQQEELNDLVSCIDGM